MKTSFILIATVAIIGLAIGLAVIQANINQKAWNEGYCECGTHWELKGATKVKNGSTTKYYACPNCFEEIEIKS